MNRYHLQHSRKWVLSFLGLYRSVCGLYLLSPSHRCFCGNTTSTCVCVCTWILVCIYIYTNTRYRYAALYYIYNRIVIHAYISYIYISRAYKRYYWQSIVSASLYLHVQDRQGLSDIKGVVTAAFQHHSMHCCDTLGETWWAPRVMLRPIPGKMLGIAGVKKLKTGLPPLVNYIT